MAMTDPVPFARKRVSAALLGLFFLSLLCSLSFGSSDFGLSEAIFGGVSDIGPNPIYDLRLPRFLVATGVGAALAISGVLLQAVLRNPLVEPGVIGLNSGAALAAGIALVLSAGFVSPGSLAIWSVVGSGLAVALVVALAFHPGSTDPNRLILSGIAVTAFCSALLTAVTLSGSPQRVQRLLGWLSGNMNGAGYNDALLIWGSVSLSLPLILIGIRFMDVMALDRISLASLGGRRQWPGLSLLCVAAVLAGAATAVCGILIFVGLIAPHVARRLFGTPHRYVIPAAAVIGAVLVSLTDLVGRLIVAPTQVPAGLMTAILGAPVFFLLMRPRLG